MIVHVYPVGVLHAVRLATRAVRIGRRATAWSFLRHEGRYLVHQVNARRWRAVRSAFNGYLAEPVPIPDGLVRCGRGWTERAALRDLERQLRKIR